MASPVHSAPAPATPSVPVSAPAPVSVPNLSQRIRRAAATGWLEFFFWMAKHAPRLLQALRPAFAEIAFQCSAGIRRGTLANARHLLGSDSTPADRYRLARKTLCSFYTFCCDIARRREDSLAELRQQIESVIGEELYLKARQAGRGAIVVTAHMGSFEVAMAALRGHEEHVHVLFHPDANDRFEAQRSQLRRRLGVHEVAVDDGWTVWIRLREALRANQVVVIQGDRVLPGQRGKWVNMFGSEMELPASPVVLAMTTGSPIVPVFCIRTASGKIQIIVEQPIEVAPDSAPARGQPHPALLQIACAIEKQIKAHPDQWHVLQPAWRDDKETAESADAGKKKSDSTP